MLTNPLHSIPKVAEVFHRFRLVSFYKLNASICQILGLEFWVPKLNSSMYSSNFAPLLQSLSAELEMLKSGSLTTVGRIASFKMIILPRIVYLFRTIIIPIPHVFFQKLQRTLSAFIWNNQQPRSSSAATCAPKHSGGMGHQTSNSKI